MNELERDDLSWIEVLDSADCWGRLASQPVGRVAFIEDGLPRVLPINYAVDGNTLVFRTSSLFADTVTPVPISFETDHYELDSRTGWSVVVRGSLERVVDADDTERCERTGLLGWAPGERNHWFRIAPNRVTGRAIGRRRHAHDEGFLPYMPSD
jgi:nitroimidazol reductase NimA-like FMN-containing flavoprotein (pyridoxamine 5'-phosphate oxidase superfamily)